MNVLLDHKIIWLSPERSGSELFSKLFQKKGFFRYDERTNFKLIPIRENFYSDSNKILEEYGDFNIISTIRNPYDRVWSCFLEFFYKSEKKPDFETVKTKFNEYLDNVFIETLNGIILDQFFLENTYYNKWKFEDFVPNRLIKFETIKSDLENLSFIEKHELDEIENIENHNSYEKDFLIPFNLVYEFQNAQKIYQFYKNHFLLFGYDPFSFTEEVFSDEIKIKFVHGYL